MLKKNYKISYEFVPESVKTKKLFVEQMPIIEKLK
jgi:hypothetical protein